jgi:hypothetical protein
LRLAFAGNTIPTEVVPRLLGCPAVSSVVVPSSGLPDVALAEALLGKLDEAPAIAAAADAKAIARLVEEPRPRAVVRRVPPI